MYALFENLLCSANEDFDTTLPVNAVIRYDGNVTYNPPAIVTGIKISQNNQVGPYFSIKEKV